MVQLHAEVLSLVKSMPEYTHAFEDYIDFTAGFIPHTEGTPPDQTTDSIVFLTLVVDEVSPAHAYFVMAISEPNELCETLPPEAHRAQLRAMVDALIERIKAAGVYVGEVRDESPKEVAPA